MSEIFFSLHKIECNENVPVHGNEFVIVKRLRCSAERIPFQGNVLAFCCRLLQSRYSVRIPVACDVVKICLQNRNKSRVRFALWANVISIRHIWRDKQHPIRQLPLSFECKPVH